jgi:iron-sulfur cluster insertion protein
MNTAAMEITFTDKVVERVNKTMEEEQNPGLKLRVAISGGGCSGFSYDFRFDEPQADDIVYTKDGATFLVDPMSYQYLIGAQIDYTEDHMGGRLVVTNPNATTTCGCGASFSAD